MLAPLSWLKEYVDIDVTPKELEEKLFSCGFEVEELIEVGKDISNVVVGLVESCEPIPDTHLSLCQVNAGEHGTFQICCGADNVRAGGKYPLYLKRRIMSRTGHLCNNQTGKLISEIMSPRLKHVLLGHLSRENNTPGLALETVQKEIKLALGDDMLKKIDISVAPQDGMSALVEL